MDKKEISILLGLIISFAVAVVCGDIHTAQNIQNNTLRLHVIANSNSSYDQKLKLDVKDFIVTSENLMPPQQTDFASAVEDTQQKLNSIEQQINNYLKDKNVAYKAVCSVEDFYFDTTQYNGFVLPQGEYTALTVRLGKAQGKNWWCVIYPALCSQSCGEVVLQNSDEFIQTQTVTARFKVVEIYEDVKQKFVQRKQSYTNLQ